MICFDDHHQLFAFSDQALRCRGGQPVGQARISGRLHHTFRPRGEDLPQENRGDQGLVQLTESKLLRQTEPKKPN